MTKKLQEMRLKAGLSQSELAEKADLNVRMIQHYEQEVRNLNNARFYVLMKLCISLNCQLEDILSNKEYLKLLNEYKKSTV